MCVGVCVCVYVCVCACIGVCAPSHEGVVRGSRPGHVADGPARHPAEGGVEAEREGQGHSQSPDTHDHHLGGSGRQARLQGMDDGHVPVQVRHHRVQTSEDQISALGISSGWFSSYVTRYLFTKQWLNSHSLVSR